LWALQRRNGRGLGRLTSLSCGQRFWIASGFRCSQPTARSVGWLAGTRVSSGVLWRCAGTAVPSVHGSMAGVLLSREKMRCCWCRSGGHGDGDRDGDGLVVFRAWGHVDDTHVGCPYCDHRGDHECDAGAEQSSLETKRERLGRLAMRRE
jgi:hypothetical protein